MEVIFNTNGSGLWSSEAKAVRIVDMQIGYVDDEFSEDGTPDFGELRVYFDTETWDCDEDGLIYTDRQFMREMQEFLKAHGIAGDDVSYSEQGMQGDDYVSCDVGLEFFASWGRKFGVDWTAVVKKQQDDFNERWGLTA